MQISVNIRESAKHSYNSVPKYCLALKFTERFDYSQINCGMSLLLVEDQNNNWVLGGGGKGLLVEPALNCKLFNPAAESVIWHDIFLPHTNSFL